MIVKPEKTCLNNKFISSQSHFFYNFPFSIRSVIFKNYVVGIRLRIATNPPFWVFVSSYLLFSGGRRLNWSPLSIPRFNARALQSTSDFTGKKLSWTFSRWPLGQFNQFLYLRHQPRKVQRLMARHGPEPPSNSHCWHSNIHIVMEYLNNSFVLIPVRKMSQEWFRKMSPCDMDFHSWLKSILEIEYQNICMIEHCEQPPYSNMVWAMFSPLVQRSLNL